LSTAAAIKTTATTITIYFAEQGDICSKNPLQHKQQQIFGFILRDILCWLFFCKKGVICPGSMVLCFLFAKLFQSIFTLGL